jgi:hypothetical protein
MIDDKYLPPEQDKGDAAYAAGRALMSAIPVAGGAAVELFQFIITPPIERRRNQWMKEIGQAVRDLEQNKGIDIEQLKSNDVFVDTLLQASQIALRNSLQEKISALKNAVMNSALPHPIEQTLQQMFLDWIDTFTIWHLKILILMDNPELGAKLSSNQEDKVDMDEIRNQWIAEGGDPQSPARDRGSFVFFIEAVYPELKERKSFYPQIVRDLYNHGLISVENLETIGWDRILAKRITELGTQFLMFVKEPY